ncbi:MAG: peptidoglycan-binding domain-containing protein [Actinomycetaceae bacterium]|nr:peptidoglycan-binding domain-containing protein [Actinomycetaceae bacterium]
MKIKLRGKWLVAAVLAGAIVLVIVTWLLATLMVSPSQRQAAAKPPEARPVTVPVERHDLAEQTTANATATYADTVSVPLPTGGSTSTVTRLGVEQGQNVSSGSVLAWVNGRPVFALKGPFNMYRDISEGMSGDDVQMIQRALGDAGYPIRADGSFGSYTTRCIKDLYRRAGATPQFGASENESQNPDKNDKGTPAPPPKDKPATGKLMLPTSEVVIVGNLPARLVGVPTVGQSVDGKSAKVTLSGGKLQLEASVPAEVAVKIKRGTTASANYGDKTVQVQVVDIKQSQNKPKTPPADGGDESNGGGQGDTNTKIVLAPISAPIAENWAGKDQILVTLNLTEPIKGALVVPRRAVAYGNDGTGSVLVKNTDGTFTKTKVGKPTCVQGMCAISVGALKEGQLVRVDR